MSAYLGTVVSHTIGGGWGTEVAEDGDISVRIIRGADFPQVELRNVSSCPVRYEPEKKVLTRALRSGDIVLETSGGTADRPTGRTIFIDDATVAASDEPLIPASFCRLIRVDPLKAVPAFVYFALQNLYRQGGTWEFQNTSTGISNFQYELFQRRFSLPNRPLAEQQAIAEVLGALDDKIAANTALATTAASAATTEMRATVRGGAIQVSIGDAATLIVRGIAPRYLPDGEGTRVLNQKCVRGQVVSLDPSRWTDNAKIKDEKLLALDDVLINSTGQGTLGRVARWTASEIATVDSHITIVRPDRTVSDPAVIGQAILAIEADIESLGEGSTGQTELSRTELSRARIRIPDAGRAANLGATIRALAARQDAARAENVTLAATRDALLPQLMSGMLRVRDAEGIAAEAGA